MIRRYAYVSLNNPLFSTTRTDCYIHIYIYIYIYTSTPPDDGLLTRPKHVEVD